MKLSRKHNIAAALLATLGKEKREFENKQESAFTDCCKDCPDREKYFDGDYICKPLLSKEYATYCCRIINCPRMK